MKLKNIQIPVDSNYEVTPKIQQMISEYANMLLHTLSEKKSISIVEDSEHKFVDLGLSSGLKWATCNIGALEPEDCGCYFAWGEVETKSKYVKQNSKTYALST